MRRRPPLTRRDDGFYYRHYPIIKENNQFVIRIGNALAFYGSSVWDVANRTMLAGY